MNKLIIIFCFVCSTSFAQNVGIGTTAPKASAQLDIESNNKGILIPRMSNTQRSAIAGPAKGLMVYDTTYSSFFYYDGGRWRAMYERNYDSTTIDYSSVASTATNLSVNNGTFSYVPNNLNSGFIYDNGGPTGNYLPSVTSGSTITKDDSTVLIKITIEEISAEDKVDFLYLITGEGANADTVKRTGSLQLGTYTFNSDVRVVFYANATIQQAGFKIRWARVKTNGALQTPIPQYGWHFDARKMAAMGGVQEDNNWNKDSLGFGSLSYGIGAKAKGNHSFGLGRQAFATGLGSASLGYQNKATGDYSTAFGFNTKANGYNATAFGNNTIADAGYSVVLGRYNVQRGNPGWVNTDDLFVIGNGTAANARSNALTISKNGNMVLNGSSFIEGAQNVSGNSTVTGYSSANGGSLLAGTTTVVGTTNHNGETNFNNKVTIDNHVAVEANLDFGTLNLVPIGVVEFETKYTRVPSPLSDDCTVTFTNLAGNFITTAQKNCDAGVFLLNGEIYCRLNFDPTQVNLYTQIIAVPSVSYSGVGTTGSINLNTVFTRVQKNATTNKPEYFAAAIKAREVPEVGVFSVSGTVMFYGIK